MGLPDFVRLCCNASECDEQHSSDIRRCRIDCKISELVVGELIRWRNDRKPLTPGKPVSHAEKEWNASLRSTYEDKKALKRYIEE